MIRRETLTVQNMKATVGTSGQTKYTEPDGKPFGVPVNTYPLSADESVALGLQDSESRKVFADSWPATRRAQLRIRGGLWEQVGPVQQFDALPGNVHVEVTIKRIGDA